MVVLNFLFFLALSLVGKLLIEIMLVVYFLWVIFGNNSDLCLLGNYYESLVRNCTWLPWLQIVKLLLEHDAQPELPDADGRYALPGKA